MQGGRVPMFKKKPMQGPMRAAIIVLLLGVLLFFEGYRDPGNISAHNRANAILALSIVGSGILIIISTGRMWFKHLQTDRRFRRR